MLLVVDTNVLVAECLRERRRERLENPLLELVVTERVDGEFQYEFRRRLTLVAERARLSPETRQAIENDALNLYERKVFVIAEDQYAAFESQARLRIPRDPDDWPTVALALALNADVWTEDQDFFGCGVAVWRTDVLYAHLDDLAASSS